MRHREPRERLLHLAVGSFNLSVENRNDDLTAVRLGGAGPRLDFLPAPTDPRIAFRRRLPLEGA